MNDLKENHPMPLFDCYCLNCSTEETNRIYEVLIPLNELKDDIPCPDCGQLLSRLMPAPYFVVR